MAKISEALEKDGTVIIGRLNLLVAILGYKTFLLQHPERSAKEQLLIPVISPFEISLQNHDRYDESRNR
jgi:hypothetical protein